MSEDIGPAFMHPEGRAAATAGIDPLDRISLRGYTVDVEIGAFQAERGARQRIEFNVVVEVTKQGDPDDDVDRVLSYDLLTEAISVELEFERINLLETLAERIACRILAEPRAMRVFIRIEKLDRIPGRLGVEIVRSRGRSQKRRKATSGERPLRPAVVYLSEQEAASTRLPTVIDRLEALDQPAILSVGGKGQPMTFPRSPQICRRLALLVIEQNAWFLSAQDPRLIVADTRTELDWALSNGKIPIWAPSKMVLGAVGAPIAEWVDPLELVIWFAGEMNAAELVTVGIAAPAGVDLVCREMPMDSE